MGVDDHGRGIEALGVDRGPDIRVLGEHLGEFESLDATPQIYGERHAPHVGYDLVDDDGRVHSPVGAQGDAGDVVGDSGGELGECLGVRLGPPVGLIPVDAVHASDGIEPVGDLMAYYGGEPAYRDLVGRVRVVVVPVLQERPGDVHLVNGPDVGGVGGVALQRPVVGLQRLAE